MMNYTTMQCRVCIMEYEIFVVVAIVMCAG